MKTYSVQKRVENEKTTEINDKLTFDNLKEAEVKFNEILEDQETYAGEYNDGEFSSYYNEVLEIEVCEDDDCETLKEVVVYYEGMVDKNNWKGEHAVNYWGIAKHNGQELIYNFYDNGKDLKIEYKNIKSSELSNWYNYK